MKKITLFEKITQSHWSGDMKIPLLAFFEALRYYSIIEYKLDFGSDCEKEGKNDKILVFCICFVHCSG